MTVLLTADSAADSFQSSRMDLPVTTLGMAILLGPVVLIYMFAKLAAFKRRTEVVSESTLTALRCGSILAAVLGLCYFCEHHFPFPHAEKSENFMMYWASFAVLIIGSLFTLRKSNSSEFLCRDQTEEWKGWMQFLFLAYHYWKMERAYNDIRVYITCYLWMTGFGNFSFFYMKEDFSLIRVLQMTWRMNFFCACLCLTMNNPYIVYYICPLHTFYFLLTYATMYVWKSVNRSQHGAAVKILVAVGLVYLVYDLVPSAFELVFGWLSTQSTGASIGNHGVKWEWYFRSFLDHFSTLWGMVFALNMPFVAEWFKQIESFSAGREWMIKLTVSTGLLSASAAWVAYVYMRPKNDYNALHCYYSIVPLLTYLFLRNISSTTRSHYLHLLHMFGQITLESYLLQYHIWLADNAGKLLNIIPGYPIATYCVATCLHIFCANQIFHVTTKLKEIVLPNNLNVALQNLAIIAASTLASCVCALVILKYGITVHFVLAGMVIMSLVAASFLFAPVDLGQPKAMSSSDRRTHFFVGLLVISIVTLNFVPRVVMQPAEVQPSSMLEMVTQKDSLENLYFSLSSLAQSVRASPLTEEVTGGSILQMPSVVGLSAFELNESRVMGMLFGFEIGSLAQPLHGLVAVAMIALCIVMNDPFFGLGRLALLAFAPEGKKTISWEEAYSPLLERLQGGAARRIPQDAEAVGESTPLMPEAVGERTPLMPRNALDSNENGE